MKMELINFMLELVKGFNSSYNKDGKLIYIPKEVLELVAKNSKKYLKSYSIAILVYPFLFHKKKVSSSYSVFLTKKV